MTQKRVSAVDRDEHVSGRGGANVTSVRLIGADKPLLTAVALALSVMSTILAFFAFQELSACEYWLSRNEAFLEQLAGQGIKVPQSLLDHGKDK